MITQDLGIATAYGYAKSKGYTGTEAEFAELMASYASTAQTAIEAADRAVEANTAAQSAKTDASASASTASIAAQTATTAASEASQSASTATTKASEASQSASTASAAATSAGTSAQTATTAAATATTKASEASESAATASTAKTDAETARDAAAQSASEAAASAESIDPATLEHKAYGAYVVESASGAIASFADGADSIPMKDVLVHIEPVQAGSGDPSPDNVRPITGWTGAKVTRTGVNVWDEESELGTIDPTTGENSSSSSRWGSKNLIPIQPDTDYCYRCGADDSNKVAGRVCYYDANGDYLSGNATFPGGGANFTNPAVFHTPANAYYMRFSPADGPTYENDTSINYPSTDHDYHTYQGQTYDITFPTEAGTVYGGLLDVTSGVLTVDRAIKNVQTSLGTYNAKINALLFYSSVGILSDASTPANNNTPFSAIAEPININSASAINDGGYGIGLTTTKDIYLRTVGASSKDDYLSIFPNGINVVYELATPITYQLTPQEITSLLGTNNLWADTGDSEVEYRADTKLYITKKITEAVSALS